MSPGYHVRNVNSTIDHADRDIVPCPLGLSVSVTHDDKIQTALEEGNQVAQNPIRRLSKGKGVLLICTISSAGFLTVRLPCFYRFEQKEGIVNNVIF